MEFEIGELLKRHPYRTLRIVAHSMGGLVAREYILRRQHHAHPQLKLTNVVTLATPNNGSELAKLGWLIPENRQVEELRHIDKGNTYLESLNKDWNREFKGGAHPRHVLLFAGYEELAMTVLGQIVTLSSAIPYADASMGFQEDHIDIAKPKERNTLYRWVKAKLEESLEKTARQLVDGMVRQGLVAPVDAEQRLPRIVEMLEGLQTLAGTELEKVLTSVKAGEVQKALDLLAERELKERQLVEHIAQHRFTQGELHELQLQMAQPTPYYSEAVQLAPSNASYRQYYGWSLINTGDARGAILQFEETVRLSRTSSNSYLEGLALDGLGVAYLDLEKYTKAAEYHEQALAIAQKIGDVRGVGRTLGNLGAAYEIIGQSDTAIELHEQALAIAKEIEDVQAEGNHLRNLDNAYARRGEHAKAREFQKASEAIFKDRLRITSP